VRHQSILGNNHDAIADEIEGMVQLPGFAGGRNHAFVADARIFINDGGLNSRIPANANAGLALSLMMRNAYVPSSL
jgi:hypothetical protein